MSGNGLRHTNSTKSFGESLRAAQEATPPTIPEEKREEKRKQSSGLFTVVSKQWIEQSSDDSDDNLPAGTYIADETTCGRFCKSVDFRLLREAQAKGQAQKPHALLNPSSSPNLLCKNPTVSQSVPPSPIAKIMSASRFKIVPLESKYKRDRWQCHDYYDNRDQFVTRSTKPPALQTPAANPVTIPIPDNRNVRSMSDIQNNQPITPPPSQKTAPAGTKTQYPALKKAAANKSPGPQNKKTILDEIEKSLSYTEPRRTKSVTVTPPPPAQTSAIDLKIDQAMELVKTHLMFAVREEVDGLKNKISELESTVNKLEKENTLLKRNVPNHILRGLHS